MCYIQTDWKFNNGPLFREAIVQSTHTMLFLILHFISRFSILWWLRDSLTNILSQYCWLSRSLLFNETEPHDHISEEIVHRRVKSRDISYFKPISGCCDCPGYYSRTTPTLRLCLNSVVIYGSSNDPLKSSI